MSPLKRFLRFNLVGALGIFVQLASLALFNRAIPARYLLTSTLAVEFTLLHNFIWHIHYTWPARSPHRTRAALQFLRFHLSNGLISLAGNLALMRLFVHSFHSPILIANALTIACCGLANFLLAHHWVFARARSSRPKANALMASAALVFLLVKAAWAQTTNLPNAPAPHPQDFGVDCAYANVFAGPAASLGSSTHLSGTAGITFGQYAARPLKLSASPQFELGIAGPLPNHPVDGLVSADYMFATKIPHRDLYPSLTVGYSRFFATGNAINFGAGFDIGEQRQTTLRVELRDYLLISQPQQHIIGLRIGLGKLIPD
jgi:putative flippase GtrA